jgi:adenosylmethionine-8-amino-7-oxononanoate aminotransferase
MGRTGTLHAYEQEGILPDMLITAKGLAAGYQPIGAVLVSRGIFDAVRGGSGFFQHGHTYLAHPIACAAALAVQRVVHEQKLLENVNAQGGALQKALEETFREHPHIGDIRGRGLFLGVELVADRDTKAPFDPKLSLHARVKREAMARGLLCYPLGGTVDGVRGDHVLIAPPFIIDRSHVMEIAEKLTAAVDAALCSAGSAARPV